jgi:hypothetical protein
MMKFRFCVLVLAAAIFLVGVPSACPAAIYSFNPISTSSGVATANTVGHQIIMEVTNAGWDNGNQVVDFKFTNQVGFQSSVTDIYFQDGPLLGARMVLAESTGVNYSDIGVKPANLPGWNTLSPIFKTTAGFSADASTPNTGLNSAGDWVTFRFTMINHHTYDEVLAALANGFNSPGDVWDANGIDKAGGLLGLRVGIHVSAIGPSSKSDSFLNGAQIAAVPEPATLTIWGIGAGLALLGGARLRRKPETNDVLA